MLRRAPKFTVTTSALVLIAVAAFGLRFAARYLPERQPNKLALEYGEYVKRSVRETVQWFPFGQPAFGEAEARGKIVFLDIGTIASLSSKNFSEDYATDGEYRNLLHDHFEAVKIDALELPWLVDALELETDPFLAGERFMAVAMDHRGGIVSWSRIKAMHGDDSMSAWMSEVARLRYSDPGEMTRRANASLDLRKERATEALSRGPADEDTVAAWGAVWARVVEMEEFSKNRLTVTTLPMEVLDGVNDEKATLASLNLMLELALSPATDPIDGGFFVFASQAKWRGIVGAKRTGHSLQLAAVFAEFGKRHNIPLFVELAKRTADWSRARSRSGLFDAGLGTDQDYNGVSAYYAFTENEIGNLPLAISELGFPSIEPLQGFAANVTKRRSDDVFAQVDRLKKLRQQRKPLRTDSGQYANQNGQAVSGLFRIASALDDESLASEALTHYQAIKAMYVKPLGDVTHAPDGTGRLTSYCEDYVWLVRAALDGYKATGDRSLLADAELITSRMLELFRGESGALMIYLPSALEVVGYDFEVYRVDDTELPSANAVAIMNLADLAAFTGKSDYRDSAERILRAFSGRFVTVAPPAGLILAGQRLYSNRAARP